MIRSHLTRKNMLGIVTIGVIVYTAIRIPYSWLSFKMYLHVLVFGQAAWKLTIPFALICLIGVIALNGSLIRLDRRWLEFSLYKSKENSSLMPLTFHPIIRVAYLTALGVCVVFLAMVEEYIFRSLWTGWVGVVLFGGVAFGLVHMIVGVTVRMAINNGLLGIVLGVIYTLMSPQIGAGVALWSVTVIHATYNYMALAWIVYELHFQKSVSQVLLSDARLALLTRRHLPTIVKWASVKTM